MPSFDSPDITKVLHGRVIDYVAKDGERLIIRTQCGQEAVIGWYEGSRKQPGEPLLEQLNANVRLSAVGV